MEMIDVLQKLKEIAESKPELVKDAVENVERTNPKAVTEGGMKDYLHDEAEKLSREEFIKKHGESLAGFWDSINGTEESAVKEAAGISSQQIEAFKKWHEKYSKMKSRDVFNYAEGIFRAYMETGIPELDGASRQDPEGKAYDELNAIFPSMKAEVEVIGNALKANGIDPYSGEKFSEGNEDAIKEGHYPHIKSFGKLYGINDKQQYTDMADDAQSMDMGEFIDTYDNTIDMAGDFWEDHQKTSESNEGELSRLKELSGIAEDELAVKEDEGDKYFDFENSDGLPDKFISSSNSIGFISQDLEYREYTFTADQLSQFRSYRIKLVMTSTNQVYVPRVRNLRVIALA